MIHAGGVRDFEFIYENNGNPRNEAPGQARRHPGRRSADLLGQADLGRLDAARRVLVRRRRVRPRRPRRGHLRLGGPAGRPGRAVRPGDRRTRSRASTGSASTRTRRAAAAVAAAARRPSCSPTSSTAPTLGAGWDVVRRDQALTVSRRRAAHPGRGRRPLCRRRQRREPRPARSRRQRALDGDREDQLRGRSPSTSRPASSSTATTTTTSSSVASPTPRRATRSSSSSTRTRARRDNDAADSTANIAADFPDDYWVQHRVRRDERHRLVLDRRDRLDPGRPRRRRCRRTREIGVFAFGNTATAAAPEAAFDSFRITRPGRAERPELRRRVRRLDASTPTRWNASVRHEPERRRGRWPADDHHGARRHLHGRHDPAAEQLHPPGRVARRRGLGDRDEDRLGRINGGYGQGGLIAYVDGNNYVKLDPISDAGQTRINRIELRSEVAGTPIRTRRRRPTRQVAGGTAPIFYLRLTKTGTNYTGEYSFDGTTWTSCRHGDEPDGGRRTSASSRSGRRPTGQGDTVSFDYFWLDGQDSPGECECVPTGGDELRLRGARHRRSGTRSSARRTDLYAFNDGWLEIDDRQRRHLHQRQPGADEELHPPGADGRPARTG